MNTTNDSQALLALDTHLCGHTSASYYYGDNNGLERALEVALFKASQLCGRCNSTSWQVIVWGRSSDKQQFPNW